MTPEEWQQLVADVQKMQEDGIKKIASGKEYRGLLHFIGNNFHETFANDALMYSQCPDGTFFATAGRYKNVFDRDVIDVNKPVYKLNFTPDFSLIPDLDDDTGRTRRLCLNSAQYRPTKVYDITQTKGGISPNIPSFIVNKDNQKQFINSLIKVSPVPVHFCNMRNDPDLAMKGRDGGFYDERRKCIYIHNELSDNDKEKVLIDTIAKASHPEATMFDTQSISYILCDKFGIDTSHLDSLFNNCEGVINSYLFDSNGNFTKDVLAQKMDDIIIPTASDVISGVCNEMILDKEREYCPLKKNAVLFGIPVMYGDELQDSYVPHNMYGYKLVGSEFDTETGKLKGPYCITAIDNEKANVNIGGYILTPKYIALNESGFLRLNRGDFSIQRSEKNFDVPFKRTRNSEVDKKMQDNIIKSNEDVMWADHGSRFVLYKPSEDNPCDGKSYNEIRNDKIWIDGKDFEYVCGARANNEETVRDFLADKEYNSGWVVMINQYGNVSCGMIDKDDSLVSIPWFVKNRIACFDEKNPTLDDYVKNGGLEEKWTVKNSKGEVEANGYIYSQKNDNGDIEHIALIKPKGMDNWTKNYGEQKPEKVNVSKDWTQDVKNNISQKINHKERVLDKNKDRSRGKGIMFPSMGTNEIHRN